jgi:chitinase
MKSIAVRLIAFMLIVCASGTTPCFAARPAKTAIIAYVFPRDRVLGQDEVVGTLLTRVNYAFANIENGKIVTGFSHDRENFQVLTNLKKTNPRLEVLVSVGGWLWSGGFSDVALTESRRKVFIDSVVEFVRDNKLDGLDIDWEYPGLAGNGNKFRPEDKQNFTELLRELRLRFNKEQKSLGRPLVLSIAAGSSEEFIANTEMMKVQRYVDSVNLMCYDYYESDSDAITGHHAPLYANPADPKHASSDASVALFEKAGVPAQKLVLGVPFYGHTWADVGDTNHGLYQPGKKSTVWANYNNISGTLLANGFARYWDSVSNVPWLYNAATRTFISYEDPESLGVKCQYIRTHRLGGMMFWEYTGDSADHALLKAIHQGLVSPELTDRTSTTRKAVN